MNRTVDVYPEDGAIVLIRLDVAGNPLSLSPLTQAPMARSPQVSSRPARWRSIPSTAARAGFVAIGLLLVQPLLRTLEAQGPQVQSVVSSIPDRPSEFHGRSDATTHVRFEDARLRQILARAADASPTLQNLLARLEDSDVVAYVECDLRLRSRVAGYLTFVSAAGGVRYVRIRVAHVGAPSRQAALIGHELRHAVEVAALPAIVDETSFNREYARIGVESPSTGGNGVRSYETRNAFLAGEQILRELRDATE